MGRYYRRWSLDMSVHEPPSISAKLTEYKAKGVTKIKLGLTDIDGVIRGKYVSLEKFTGLLEKQGGFCDCVFGWDVNDQRYDTSGYTGWQTGFPDTGYQLVADTERWLEDENCPYFIAQFAQGEDAHPLCPRTRLKQILEKYAERGLTVRSGFEYEFSVFEESPHSIRDKGYRGMKSITPGNFGYSVLRASVESDVFGGLMAYAQSIDCDLEAIHCETGPGAWEAALRSEVGLEAADRAALFKTFAKVFLQKQGLMGTFMAKWSMDYPGQGGHFHFSVADLQGVNQFYDEQDPRGVSALQRHAVGGLQRYLPELLALLAPTINSYTRLVKGAWAPTAATWGIENRTVGIRIVPGGASAQRIECRISGADANPYLVAAAVCAAVLRGIEEALEPTSPIEGNAYEQQDALPLEQQLPINLRQAAERLASSTLAIESFGAPFTSHFVQSRLFECAEYERNLNSWQLERYFEII